MARYPHNPSDDDEAEAWVDLPRPLPDSHFVADSSFVSGVDEPGQSPLPEGVWFAPLQDTPDTAATGRFSGWWVSIGDRLPRGAWAALGAAIAILTGVLVGTATESRDAGQQVQATAAPPSPTNTAQGPCAGLSGEVVTDRAGDPATLAGVIASFESAYYIDRDASKAMPLLAPETGITAEALAAGIASIPPGTRHCVAITAITPTTANVHIAELRPDRTRVDYLQLINTRPAADTGTGTALLLISNFQKQG
ncbi:hypothetical protein [Nocardia gamkensis]|uniref:DUF8176 domain-containing protein n=1 Tax=Nocardia gamkensis TaxID=352869 RepID=A0A7X6L232_9NOCA|nr:hypothetical protein [Nocardia gamkensis]NKY26239.1 hypothetical protein [Nocardia gamkensis]NQE72620.1 hypothetical protein [Nocardia gamkensis]